MSPPFRPRSLGSAGRRQLGEPTRRGRSAGRVWFRWDDRAADRRRSAANHRARRTSRPGIGSPARALRRRGRGTSRTTAKGRARPARLVRWPPGARRSASRKSEPPRRPELGADDWFGGRSVPGGAHPGKSEPPRCADVGADDWFGGRPGPGEPIPERANHRRRTKSAPPNDWAAARVPAEPVPSQANHRGGPRSEVSVGSTKRSTPYAAPGTLRITPPSRARAGGLVRRAVAARAPPSAGPEVGPSGRPEPPAAPSTQVGPDEPTIESRRSRAWRTLTAQHSAPPPVTVV